MRRSQAPRAIVCQQPRQRQSVMNFEVCRQELRAASFGEERETRPGRVALETCFHPRGHMSRPAPHYFLGACHCQAALAASLFPRGETSMADPTLPHCLAGIIEKTIHACLQHQPSSDVRSYSCRVKSNQEAVGIMSSFMDSLMHNVNDYTEAIDNRELAWGRLQ